MKITETIYPILVDIPTLDDLKNASKFEHLGWGARNLEVLKEKDDEGRIYCVRHDDKNTPVQLMTQGITTFEAVIAIDSIAEYQFNKGYQDGVSKGREIEREQVALYAGLFQGKYP